MYDASTDNFCGIRFVNNVEKEQRKSYNLMPSESSLSYFIRKACVVTPFRDTIPSREFTRRYVAFCRREIPGGSVPVTKRALEKLGVKFKRLHVTYLECRPFRSNTGLQQINFDLLNLKKRNQKDKVNSFSFIMDSASVTLNVVTICIMPLPMFFIALLLEISADEISPLSFERRVSYVSMNSIVSTMDNMQVYTFFLTIWAIATSVLAAIELITHYATFKGNLEEQTKSETGMLRSTLHLLIRWLIIMYFVFIFSYVGLALVWLILSAVVNPEVYLPYAVGASTIIQFVVSKIHFHKIYSLCVTFLTTYALLAL
jgi:hypothetical protein